MYEPEYMINCLDKEDGEYKFLLECQMTWADIEEKRLSVDIMMRRTRLYWFKEMISQKTTRVVERKGADAECLCS